MKCLVIEGEGTVSVAYKSWCSILQAEEKQCIFTEYPTVGEARLCGVALAGLVVKQYIDWTRKPGGHIAPNTWEVFK